MIVVLCHVWQEVIALAMESREGEIRAILLPALTCFIALSRSCSLLAVFYYI